MDHLPMGVRDQILLLLEEGEGNWVSTEALCKRITVTRSSLSKYISLLKKDGYRIESSRRRGYLLQEASDLLVPRRIREGLVTRVFGRKEILYFTETDSTNIRAKDIAARGASEGTIVLSEKQTKGRGRKARNWFSPPRDGIYLSLILRPKIAPREAPRITLLTAVAIAETLLSMSGLEIAIKWPNDILANGKKLAGILTEMSTKGERINYVVAGLGLNVHTPRFPDEIQGKATSILMETGKQFPRVALAQEYLKWHEDYYGVLQSIGFEPIRRRWKELANIVGQRVTVETIDTEYSGEVQDIDNDGALILKDKTGRSHRIIFGDVTLR